MGGVKPPRPFVFACVLFGTEERNANGESVTFAAVEPKPVKALNAFLVGVPSSYINKNKNMLCTIHKKNFTNILIVTKNYTNT